MRWLHSLLLYWKRWNEALERSAVEKLIRPLLLTPKKPSCTEVEAALGSELPPSARKFAAWWESVPPEPGQQASTQAWVLPRSLKLERRSHSRVV